MKTSIYLGLALAALLVIIRPSPAAAEFAVCNSSTYGNVNVAWAATWNDSSGNAHGESQGWWVVTQGDCKIVITTLDISAYTIYLYAFADDQPSVHYWGGSYKYCVDPSHKFLYQGNAMITPCSSGKAYGMRSIVTGNTSTYAYFLRD